MRTLCGGWRTGEWIVMSLQSWGGIGAGEFGQKKFLWETLALCGVHNSTRLDKTSSSTDGLQYSHRNLFLPHPPAGKVMTGLKTRSVLPRPPSWHR